jgi:hypothetical protein
MYAGQCVGDVRGTLASSLFGSKESLDDADDGCGSCADDSMTKMTSVVDTQQTNILKPRTVLFLRISTVEMLTYAKANRGHHEIHKNEERNCKHRAGS